MKEIKMGNESQWDSTKRAWTSAVRQQTLSQAAF
jgi:hypothetical protein